MSVASLVGGILFGSIGFIALIYGKKELNFRIIIIGILLMVYPYAISNTLAVYGIGVALTAALFFFRD